MAYRPYIKDASGKLTDLPLAAETAVNSEKAAQADNATNADTAKNYATDGTIKTKFDSVDTSLQNVGKLKIGSTWYQARRTTSTSDTGQSGYITFIL